MAPLLFPLNLAPVGGEPPARRWLAGIELATMRCPRYTLPPFADLAGFCGVRASLEARLTDPAASVPPLTGEYRAAVETLTDLTRSTGVGPPAPLFARGSTVVDFFRNRPWPPSLAGWPAAYPDSLLDVRDRARFFDGSNDARADVLRERFPRVLRPLVTLPRVVDGSPPFEQHDYALTLMRVYTPEALPRLLASFQTPDAALARAWAQVTSLAATLAERVQQLISQRQILDEEDRRPGASLSAPAAVVAGGGGAKSAVASSGCAAPVSPTRAPRFASSTRTAPRFVAVSTHRSPVRRWRTTTRRRTSPRPSTSDAPGCSSCCGTTPTATHSKLCASRSTSRRCPSSSSSSAATSSTRTSYSRASATCAARSSSTSRSSRSRPTPVFSTART